MSTPPTFASRFTPLWLGDRGGTEDFVHLGAFAAARSDGALVAWSGDPEALAFLRSSAKPFQGVAFLRRDLPRRLGLTDADVACACASHSGEDRHVESARRILAAAGLAEDALLCGTHPPFGGRPSSGPRLPVHNNCSGKHAAMLATCRHEGWPLESYTERTHPLQVENLTTLAAFAGVRPDDVVVATDNCTVPTFALSLRAGARAFARLWDGVGLEPALADAGRRAAEAMVAFPEMVGGTTRLDTALMSRTGGRLVVKTGANGYYAAAQRGDGPRPAIGFTLKLAAAEAEAQKSPVVLACMRACDLLSAEEHADLARDFDPPQRNCRGAVVGSARFVGEVRRA